MEWKIKAETGTLTKSKRFRDVAEKAIACMELELANGGGIASYREYIHVLKRYHVTFSTVFTSPLLTIKSLESLMSGVHNKPKGS